MNSEIKMSDFGFSESSESDIQPADVLIDILAENPEIINRLNPDLEFLNKDSVNSFSKTFFEDNPDVALEMEIAGKDVESIKTVLISAFTDLQNQNWRRISGGSLFQ